MLFLLDTNILSDLVRNPSGIAASKVSKTDPAELCTSIIVASEMWFGATKRNSISLPNKLSALFEEIKVINLEPPVQHHYASLRTALERAGTPISANDLFIAAHALALNATLVTGNEREFARVPNLKIENWLV